MVYRYSVEIDYPNGGGPGYNIWHFRSLSAQDFGDLIEALETFYTTLSTEFQVGTVVRGPTEVIGDIETESPTIEAVDGFTVNTTGSGEALSPALQAVVGWRTASATRSGRGRTFVGPLNESTNDANGTLAAGTLGNLQDASQALVDFNGSFGNGAFGVWSPTDGVLRDFTGRRVRDQFAVLRSRRD